MAGRSFFGRLRAVQHTKPGRLLFGQTARSFKVRAFAMGGFAGGYLALKTFVNVQHITHGAEDGSTTGVFDHMATFYDEMMDKEELGTIQDMRRRLLRQAEGEVLELAVGTGRNFGFYPQGDHITSVTAVDISEQMLKQAAAKLPEFPELAPKLQLQQVDVHKLPFADDSFDTVLETMGLCSYEDPVAVLKEMGRVSRPGARILLFEHGESSHWMVRWFQKQRREAHKAKYGCDYAKPVAQIIQESGLKVRHMWTAEHDTLVFAVAYKDFDSSPVFKAQPDPRLALPKDLKPEDFY